MKFDIDFIASAENELIQGASQQYGEVFDNSLNSVSFAWNFIKSVDPSAWIFISFLSQVLKSLSLSLLSAIRKHAIQSNIMLRHTLESAALASYGLTKFEPDEFVHIDSKGLAHEKKQLKKKVYDWLNNNYADEAKNIKHVKEVINKVFAHSSILQTQWNCKLQDVTMEASFFDKDDDLLEKQRFWAIANTTLGLLNLFSKVANDYPKILLVDNFNDRMAELWESNNKIKAELMQHERFKRWHK